MTTALSSSGHVIAGHYNQTVAASTTGNYSYAAITTATANDTVNRLLITPTATTNASVYNGTTAASVTIVPTGMLKGDVVAISGTGILSSPNAGSNTVAISAMALSGADSSDYALRSTTGWSTSIITTLPATDNTLNLYPNTIDYSQSLSAPANLVNDFGIDCKKYAISSGKCRTLNREVVLSIIDDGINLNALDLSLNDR